VRATKRRIVFVSLHFGPFDTLVYWLRSQGLPVTALVGLLAPRQALKQRQYALSPPSGLPVVLPVTEPGSLREAVSRGQHLLVFMDVERGR
jgi:lauroyl/myristoyl acyltransferase